MSQSSIKIVIYTCLVLFQMQDRLAIFLINLKPAKMRGIMSEGMIMCASSPDLVEIIDPPPGAAVGDQVTVDGYDGEFYLVLCTCNI